MGLFTLIAAVMLSTAATPTVSYTNDSVYTKDCVTMTVVEEEDLSYTLVLEQKDLLGYCVYDETDTPHIDGLRLDEEYIYNWEVTNYDPTVEHTLYIKTVYTTDVAGMLAAAKDGDFSAVLSNPLTILQLIYYIIAGLSIILGGFGLLKSRKVKIKDHNEIAATVKNAATESMLSIETLTSAIIENVFIPAVKNIQDQSNGILEALILSKNDDADSKLAMVDLLKRAATGFDAEKLAEETKEKIKEALAKQQALLEAAKKAKEQILENVQKVADGVFEEETTSSDGNDYGGISV